MASLAEDIAGALAVEVYRRCSEIPNLVAFGCAAADNPLTEVQETRITQAVIHVIDGIEATFASMLEIDADIRTGKFDGLAGTP